VNTHVFLSAAAFAAVLSTAARADVVISSDPTQNMSCSAGVCSPTDHQAVLNVSDLENMLAASDVTVSTHVYNKNRYAYGIQILAPLSWSSSSELTLTSRYGGYVRIDAPVSVQGAGGLVISYNATLANGIPVTFANLGSVFSIFGTTYTLVGDLPTLASDIAVDPKGSYALAGDYDASGDQFPKAPIESFSGVLLGLGHTISSLTIQKGYKLCEGMIATNSGIVSHLSLSNVTVNLDKNSRYVGGITGCNLNSLTDVAVSGQVTGNNQSDAGGIAGINFLGTAFARSQANVSGGEAGGIVGENDGRISLSSAGGTVNGIINTGGLAGANTNSIALSHATGNVTGSKNNTGGLVGSNRGDIQNCYALGNVDGGSGAAGGFVGFNGGTVQYAYSTGAVAGSKKYTGGFAGYDPNEAMATTYWDTDTSGISNPSRGAGFPKYDPGIKGLTTAKLKSRVPDGFDHRDWRQNAGINNGYPYLKKNPPQ
jgi:hypothetical protein